MRTTLNKKRWQFGHVPRQSFHASTVNDIQSVETWLPATVPGNVRLDLLAPGLIPDPFWEEQYQKSDWVDEVDWWYRTTLETEVQADQRAFIRFHGIDYLSAIFVNGREMTRHEGMFSRQSVEVTEAALLGDIELTARIWGSGALPRRQLNLWQKAWQGIAQPLQGGWGGVYPDRSATLKTQTSFGWDFAPRILTAGIWDEVELITTGSTFIEDCQVNVPPSGKGEILLTLNTLGDEEIPVTFTISPHNFQGDSPLVRQDVILSAAAQGQDVILSAAVQGQDNIPSTPSVRTGLSYNLPFTIPNPKLWHPWDRGDSHLYNLQVDIPGSDSLNLRFGIRSIELQDWQFQINGQNEFIRGLNWVPADVFPGRITADDYRELLQLAKESGANMLRVWGGGLREKQAFYNLCDEMGLLVWQEFPLACMFLGTYPRDQRFLSLVEREVAEIARQLDNHPSVAVWGGGNEFSPQRNKPLMQAMTRAVQQAGHSPRPFIPASPSPGDSHNWLVWHGKAPLAAYRRESAPFLSEFGLQALPDQATLDGMFPNPESGWQSHNGDRAKLQRYLKLFLSDNGDQRSEDGDLTELIDASQRAQAVGLQTAIEHMRRRKGQSGGVMVWQFNEPWPAISWALVDYFRRPKLAYRLLKQWYNPILLSLDFEPGMNWQAGDLFEAAVWGVNDTLDVARGAWRVELDDKVIFDAQQVSLPPDSAALMGKISHRLEGKPRQISVILRSGEAVIAQNSYDLTWRDSALTSLWQRLRRWVAELVLR